MKKRIGRVGVFFSFFIIFALISGAITFMITLHRERSNEKISTGLMIEEAKDNKKIINPGTMKEILEGAAEIYLESFVGSSDVVEIDGKDIGMIVARLKSLNLKFVKRQDVQQKDYLYAVHIKNKNVKIKTNHEYIMIENVQGRTEFFETDEQSLKDLNEELEEIYMKRYNTHELFKNPKDIQVTAMDEKKQWVLNKSEIAILLSKAQFSSPVDGQEVVGIPHIYPDYVIEIEMDHKDYRLNLINKEILVVDTEDSYTFYQYDTKLWDYMVKTYPVKLTQSTDPLKTLMESKKVVVEDVAHIYDIEDDAYYPIEISRWLMRAEKKEVEKFPDEPLMFTLSFTVGGGIYPVKIFGNHILYGQKTYFSEKIGETIKSILSVP